MTEKELVAEIFRNYPSIQYEHAPDCLAVLACDCVKPRGYHTSVCVSLKECECNGKFVGVRWKRR